MLLFPCTYELTETLFAKFHDDANLEIALFLIMLVVEVVNLNK